MISVVQAPLNVKGKREQLVEALIRTAAYLVFPTAIITILVAKEFIAEHGTSSPTGSVPNPAYSK